MDLQLKDKVALVAAASQGLGKACALEFARAGAKVAICGRNASTIEAAAADVREQTGAEVLAVQADVTNAHDIQNFVTTAAETFGRVDAVVCNAGGPPAGAFMSLQDEQWLHAIDLNLMSVVRLIRYAVPYLKQSGGGRIVNLASSSIKQPLADLVLSNTLRLGLQGLVKTLSTELGPDGILINTVAPGRIDTERVQSLDERRAAKIGTSADEVRRQSQASIALGRYGLPEEFARYVVFLASPVNTYVTGQALLVDGGLTQAL